MGFFSKILAKLGVGSDKAATAPAPAGTAWAAPPPPKPVAVVDVVAELDRGMLGIAPTGILRFVVAVAGAASSGRYDASRTRVQALDTRQIAIRINCMEGA